MPDSKAKRAGLRGEFRILRDFLLRDLTAGYAHFMIWKNCYLSGDPVPPPYDSLNTRAHFDSAMLSLIRLTDSHKDSVSFDKLLKFAENHPNLFTVEDLPADRRSFDTYLPVRENLKAIRDRHYAHPDRKYIDAPDRVFADYPVPPATMEELFGFIGGILKKYSIKDES